MITVYSKPNCPHCVRAKEYLVRNSIPFEMVDVTQNAEALAFIKENGHKTVPQLYVGKKILVEGGNASLQALTPQQVNDQVHVLLG
jgi:glutaredoxin-like protein NrdH